VHLGYDKDSFEVFNFFRFVGSNNCGLDVDPDIRCVVPIEVNDLFCIWVFGWCITLKSNGVQIILIGFSTDDVNGLVHANLGVLLTVFHLITGQNPVVAYLLKFDFSLTFYFSPFWEILNFRELSLLLLSLLLSEISAEGRFTHSWQSNGHQEKLGNMFHFWVFK
jgi:hypothetical protein